MLESLWLTSPAGWLPRIGISSGTLRSVIEYGLPLPFYLVMNKVGHTTCRRSTIGGRAFPVAGAKVWNGLPSEVTSASSLSGFKNRLKTYLFRRCYETVWLWITSPFPSHYLPPQNCGSCNSFYCLGHSKNVYDDDDDDDDWRTYVDSRRWGSGRTTRRGSVAGRPVCRSSSRHAGRQAELCSVYRLEAEATASRRCRCVPDAARTRTASAHLRNIPVELNCESKNKTLYSCP